MKEEFSIKDVVSVLQIPRERFKEWVYRGYIKPSIEKASGPGYKNLYSLTDLYGIKIFDYLLRNGTHRNVAKLMVKAFMQNISSELSDNSDSQLFVAFFRRDFSDGTMTKKGRAYVKPQGKLISNKALAPGVRFISGHDIEKTFSTLFLTFDDVDGFVKEFGHNETNFRDILIVNLRSIKNEVDRGLQGLEKMK